MSTVIFIHQYTNFNHPILQGSSKKVDSEKDLKDYINSLQKFINQTEDMGYHFKQILEKRHEKYIIFTPVVFENAEI